MQIIHDKLHKTKLFLISFKYDQAKNRICLNEDRLEKIFNEFILVITNCKKWELNIFVGRIQYVVKKYKSHINLLTDISGDKIICKWKKVKK